MTKNHYSFPLRKLKTFPFFNDHANILDNFIVHLPEGTITKKYNLCLAIDII